MDVLDLKKILTSSIIPKADNSKSKLSAVMIIICGNQPKVIMTERSRTINRHAGEISFPGGTWVPEDGDLLETAIRETKEELGIKISRSLVIGQLKSVTTLNSGFIISPFVTILDDMPKIVPNSEIASVLKIPFFQLLSTGEDDRNPSHKSIQEMYTFQFKDYVIWGASARILKQIHNKIIF